MGLTYLKNKIYPSEEAKADPPEFAMPKLLTKCCGYYKEDKEDDRFKVNPSMDDQHKTDKMKPEKVEEYHKKRSEFINKKIPGIATNWCNFG